MLPKIFPRLFERRQPYQSIEKIVLGFALVLGLLLVFIVPPFQKPDEVTHFYKAISLASGNIACGRSESEPFRNPIPRYLHEFPVQTFATHISSSTSVVFPMKLYVDILRQPTLDRTAVNEPSSCSLPLWLYIPAGLVLFIPVQLGMNPLFIFYLGRLANFVLSFGLFVYAYKKSPKGLKLIPLFILSLPIVLYQLSSFSKDALHISSGVVAFALLMSFFERNRFHRSDILKFFIATSLAVLARPQYMLFAGLSLVIPFQKIHYRRHFSKISALLFILFVVGMVGLSLMMNVYSAKAISLGNAHPDLLVYPGTQLRYLAEYPSRIGAIIGQTFEYNSGFYLQSLIGLLGYHDYGLPWYGYAFYLVFAMYVFMLVKEYLPKLSGRMVGLLLFVTLGTIVGILFSFYLYATPVGAIKVHGVQGRYFILLVPYLFWITANVRRYLGDNGLKICLAVVAMATVWGTLVRYYDESHHYYRAEVVSPYRGDDMKRSIEGSVTQIVGVEAGKKLRGISVFVHKPEQRIVKPYQLEILNDRCEKQLSKTVIDASSYVYGEWNDVLFKSVSGYPAVCVKIAPYDVTVDETESLKILEEKAGVLKLVPIYLY